MKIAHESKYLPGTALFSIRDRSEIRPESVFFLYSSSSVSPSFGKTFSSLRTSLPAVFFHALATLPTFRYTVGEFAHKHKIIHLIIKILLHSFIPAGQLILYATYSSCRGGAFMSSLKLRSCLLLLLVALFLLTCATAESYEASTMRLLRYEGNVEISDASGNTRFVMENARFNSGETMLTGEASSASVSLDSSKIVTLDVDQVIVAVGVSPNPLVPKSIEGLELGRKNTIVVNEGMQSARSEIFAGGDIVRGGATVILAMGDGRRAAQHMDEYLQKK